jgi:hypothetical protein
MKLHRRRMRLDGRDHTVITLRPGTAVRFSTNRYHETWHVLSDLHGARVLAHLLWGLSYQRVPGTLVLIDPSFLDPDPFDALPADPIALVPAGLTGFTERSGRELRRRLPLRQPHEGTVRWNTRGLAAATAERHARWDRPRGLAPEPWMPPAALRERMSRLGGVVTLTAAPAALRVTAARVAALGDQSLYGMDYCEIDYPEGEVQVFTNYRMRVSAARTARRELDPTGVAGDIAPLVWQRAEEIRSAHRRPTRAAAPS